MGVDNMDSREQHSWKELTRYPGVIVKEDEPNAIQKDLNSGVVTHMTDLGVSQTLSKAQQLKIHLESEFKYYHQLILGRIKFIVGIFKNTHKEYKRGKSQNYYERYFDDIDTLEKNLLEVSTFEELGGVLDDAILGFEAYDLDLDVLRRNDLSKLLKAAQNSYRVLGLIPRKFNEHVVPIYLRSIAQAEEKIRNTKNILRWNLTLFGLLEDTLKGSERTSLSPEPLLNEEELFALLQLSLILTSHGTKLANVNLRGIVLGESKELAKIEGQSFSSDLILHLTKLRGKTNIIHQVQQIIQDLNHPTIQSICHRTMKATHDAIKELADDLTDRGLLQQPLYVRWMAAYRTNQSNLERLKGLVGDRSLNNAQFVGKLKTTHRHIFEREIEPKFSKLLSPERTEWFAAQKKKLEAIEQGLLAQTVMTDSIREEIKREYDTFWIEMLKEIWEKRDVNRKRSERGKLIEDVLWNQSFKDVLSVIPMLRKEASLSISYAQFERYRMVTYFDEAIENEYGFSLLDRGSTRSQQIFALRNDLLKRANDKEEAAVLVDDAIKDIEDSHASTSRAFNVYGRQSRAASCLRNNFLPTCYQQELVSVRLPQQVVRQVEDSFRNKMQAYFDEYFFVSLKERKCVAEILAFIRAQSSEFDNILNTSKVGEHIRLKIKNAASTEQEKYENSWWGRLVSWVTGNKESSFAKGLFFAYDALQAEGMVPVDNSRNAQKIIEGLQRAYNKCLDYDVNVLPSYMLSMDVGVFNQVDYYLSESEQTKKTHTLSALSTLMDDIQKNNLDKLRAARAIEVMLNGLVEYAPFHEFIAEEVKLMRYRGQLGHPENPALREDLNNLHDKEKDLINAAKKMK